MTRKPTADEITVIRAITDSTFQTEYESELESDGVVVARPWITVWDDVCEKNGFEYDFTTGCTCNRYRGAAHLPECCLVKKMDAAEEDDYNLAVAMGDEDEYQFNLEGYPN